MRGPAYTISTACTSSAKALLAARRLLRAGSCDAVIAGGVDTLCRLTVGGFAALESTSPQRCNPLSRNRNGINIGEGAALFLLGRDEAAVAARRLGRVERRAPHFRARAARAPAPRRRCAPRSPTPARSRATSTTSTCTAPRRRKNDAMESRAVARVFPDGTPVSSTKPLTGHALGAAGAIEAAFCWLALDAIAPAAAALWDGEADPGCRALRVVARASASPSRHAC